MNFTASYLSYQQTNAFSNLVGAYLDGSEDLKPFYQFTPNELGILSAIEQRKSFPVNRKALVVELRRRYASVPLNEKVEKNLQLLENENCFTICTAHQPNIFTGHLYFAYKIIHAIKLADELKKKHLEYDFVPIYFMGSEDADIDELGEVFLDGNMLHWKPAQKGAIGRMVVDKPFLALIDEMAGRLEVEPYGKEIISLIRKWYAPGKTIEQSTFELVNEIFGKYGLVVLLPDTEEFKRLFINVMEKEIESRFSAAEVEATLSAFPPRFRHQASGREINLFFLDEHGRNRIEWRNGIFQIVNTNLKFTKGELISALNAHPEKFSPNVILRPVLQEYILPDIAFIGGGGELAYWLELKRVFEKSNTLFPVLILRNSFLLIDENQSGIRKKLNLKNEELFLNVSDIETNWISRNSDQLLSLDAQKEKLARLYQEVVQISSDVDVTLGRHTEALYTQSKKRLDILEKKLLRAEKRKNDTAIRQINRLKSQLFPNQILQERVENIMFWISKYGMELIDEIYAASPSFDPAFTILEDSHSIV